MKPLLHTFVLFILIWPVISHTQRRGRRRGNPNSEKIIRNFDRSPLIPRPTNDLAGTARQTLDQLQQNGRRSKTLQEAQNELNTRKRQKKTYPPKVQQVIDHIIEHTGPFTVPGLSSYFKRHLYHSISRQPIEAALKVLTSSEILTLIRPFLNPEQVAVWAKTSELQRMNKTPKEALDFYRKSGMIESSKTEQVMDYIMEHTGPFTIPGLSNHFKKDPHHPIKNRSPIQAALNELNSSGILTLIRPPLNAWQTAVWAKTSELERMNKTPKEALDFYRESGIVESSKVEQVIDHLREHTGPFSIQELHKNHFSEFPSDVPIRMALNQLTKAKELTRHTGSLYKRSYIWTKTSEKDFTQKDINEYIESSNLFLKAKTKRITTAVESQEDFFTIAMIKKYLLESSPDAAMESSSGTPTKSFSNVFIQEVLNKLEMANRVLLVQQSDRRNPNVWITKTASEKKGLSTEEDIKKDFKNSDLFMSTQSKTKKIQLFIQTLTSVFTVSDIQKQFPKSKRTVQYAIKQLISSGELTVLQVQDKTNILIRTSVLKQVENFTQSLTSAFTIPDIKNQFP